MISSWLMPMAAMRGQLGGPLKVTAHQPGALVSERSLFGNSFEEVWAIPYEELDSDYYWPSYDGRNMDVWVLVANPMENGEPVQVDLSIDTYPAKKGDPAPADIVQQRIIQPDESWTPIFPGVSGGQVEVKAYRVGGSPEADEDARKVIASERSLMNGAFNETPGLAASRLADRYLWTWYDESSSGVQNWVLVANPNGSDIYFEIYIPGVDTMSDPLAHGTLGPGQRATPSFADKIGGPAQVKAWTNADKTTPANVMASQRVLWNGYFNEIVGKGL